MRWHRRFALCALVGAPLLFSQTWSYTKLVDNNTVRPDGKGTFNVLNFSPAISGQWVVFINAADSIWSFNTQSGALVKLVDTSTPVPGGTGNFIGFPVCDGDGETALSIHGGTVLFFGQDAAAPGFCAGGYYTVPVTGGTISKILDYNTTLPDGGTFFIPTGPASLGDLGVVVVSVETTAPGDIGVWAARGTKIERIADGNTTYCYANCSGANPSTINGWAGGAISGLNIAFTGSGLFGAAGWNGIFFTSVASPTLTPILDSTQPLPGDLAPPPAGSTAAYFEYLVVDGNNVFFTATDPFFGGSSTTCGGAFWGIFETVAGSNTATNIANTCDTLPGVSQLNVANSFQSLAASGGTAIFEIYDSASGYAIYSSVKGKLTPLVQSGQTLSDGLVSSVTEPGANSIDGGHVVFEANFTAQPYSAIYRATHR